MPVDKVTVTDTDKVTESRKIRAENPSCATVWLRCGDGLGDRVVALAHEGANRGGRRVELRHLELLAHLPPSRGYRY